MDTGEYDTQSARELSGGMVRRYSPEAVEVPAKKKFFGTREDAELKARALINDWLQSTPRKNQIQTDTDCSSTTRARDGLGPGTGVLFC